MIERIWSGKSLSYILLLPLSWLYGLIVVLRRFCYQQGIFKSWQAPVAVVVVGNLTVGGNGKTPFVIWLTEQLTQAGLRVGVVSRGYGGKSAHYPLLVTSDTSTAQAGDEPVLIYQRTGVAVAVSPCRTDAVKALLANQPIDVILTDDGLQHYALRRDVEFVVIDGRRRFGNGWWLPAGPMRERETRLKQVTAVIVNGGVAQQGEIAMQLQPTEAINLLTGEKKPLAELPPLIAMAGIGHPERFFTTIKEQGAEVIRQYSFADHQTYRLAQLQSLAQPTETLLMTEKDAVKCRAFALANWWYLPVNAILSAEDANKLINLILDHVAIKKKDDVLNSSVLS